jgi:hypothetical protein
MKPQIRIPRFDYLLQIFIFRWLNYYSSPKDTKCILTLKYNQSQHLVHNPKKYNRIDNNSNQIFLACEVYNIDQEISLRSIKKKAMGFLILLKPIY